MDKPSNPRILSRKGQDKTDEQPGDRGLIVDALVWASIMKEEDAERAIKIVAEKIEVRRAFGDY
jgi:hypothetical protein